VDVDEVQPVIARHLMDGDGQRQRIGRVLEKRVVFHLNFMEVHPLSKAGEAEGWSVRHEVDFMAAFGQSEPQLRRNGS
jgi:hypothetical protein